MDKKQASKVILKLDKVKLSDKKKEYFLSELYVHNSLNFFHGIKIFEILTAPFCYLNNKRKIEKQMRKMIFILWNNNLINIKVKNWENLKAKNKYIKKLALLLNKSFIISSNRAEFATFWKEYKKLIKMHTLNKKLNKVKTKIN